MQVQVSTLRKLLGPNAIATIPGRGYRFALAGEHAPTPAAEPARARTPTPGNLPPHAAPLFGRDAALQELRERLAEPHVCVTLLGVHLHRVQQGAHERTLQAAMEASAGAADIERWQREGEALDEAQVAALVGAAVEQEAPAPGVSASRFPC